MFIDLRSIFKDNLVISSFFLLTLHVTTEMHFYFRKKTKKKYHAWSCLILCDALTFSLDYILFDLAMSYIDK